MTLDYLDDEWLFEFRQDLIQFKDDLDLIIDEDYKIQFAVDFHDIFRFSFPYAKFLHMDRHFDDPNYMKHYYESQVARCTMFFMLGKFYNKPNILLSPYATECSNFNDYLDLQARRYVYYELKEFQENPNPELLKIIEDYKISKDNTKLIDYLTKNYSQLIYHFSRGYTDSINMFYNLLINYLTNDLKVAFGDESNVKEDLYDILSVPNHQKEYYKKVRESVKNKRKRKDKISQNERDADAIYSINRLNDIYNNDKRAFFLTSSAPHLEELIKFDDLSITKVNIKSKDFKILRNPKFFTNIILEISNFFNYKMDKEKLEKINPIDLRLAILSDLSKIDFYNSYLAGSGGQFKEDIQSLTFEELKLKEAINKMELNLTILIDEYLKDNLKSYNEDDKKSATGLLSIFSKDFSKELFFKRLEIERSHIEYLITRIKDLEDSSHIALFSLPFRLNLEDPTAKSIIKSIIDLNAKGRSDFRLYKNAETTQKKIFSRLVELLDSADRIEKDEKLILWQLIFLYLGRYDLVDHIYDFFNKSLEKNLQRELAYIYILNFIKKFRIVGIYDIVLIFKIIELCDKYIYTETGKLNKSINDYKFIQIENKLYIILNRENRDTYVSLTKEIDADMEVTKIDLRFFHLKATLINRFIHDYGSIYRSIAQKIENEFRLIFIPIVSHFDNDYKISISSDLAYFLSLNKNKANYQDNLEIALAIMNELRTSVDNDPSIEPYWGYIRNYQYGYILLQSHFKLNGEARLENIIEAKKNFELSLKELPSMAENLRTIVIEKIELCNRFIEVLK